MTRKHAFRQPARLRLAALTILGLIFCAGAQADSSPQAKGRALREHQFTALRMGTQFRIVVYADDALSAQKAALAAFDRVEELEDILSDYRDGSEISRLCRLAGGPPQRVSSELYFVLENALRISRLSGGAFDVTIGPVSLLWREARRMKRLPDPAELKKARELVGYTNFVLDPETGTAVLKRPGMRIDLGGIGKGYAADQALAVLKARGYSRALVQAGGEVVVGEPPPGKPGWQIAILRIDPADAEAPGNLTLHDRGISTSGEAFQYLEINGQRYSHIIDPADGMGLRNSPAVTIVARDGITADALATAVDIMPMPEGLKLVEAIEGASAVITRRDSGGFQHIYSRGFPRTSGGPAIAPERSRTQRNQRNEH